jgi:phytoene synthase
MSAAGPTTAAEITRASKSNLALAFVALQKERREDISVFYAFCRIIDDIADDEGMSAEERATGLDCWKRALEGPQPDDPLLAEVVRELMRKYRLTPEHFLEIIAGCEMDLAGARYETWEDLRVYCYRVASAVGLVSIEIFGYTDPKCREYAIDLGLALQVTNIIRDVGVDWENGGRVYLPRAEMARFGFGEEDLAAKRETPALRALLEFEAARAEEHFARAVAVLPPADRRSMVAAEIMRNVYHRLLRKMRGDGFHVLRQRYRLSKPGKLACIAKVLAQTWLWPAGGATR